MPQNPTFEGLERRIQELDKKLRDQEREIARRRQDELTLRGSEEKYRMLFEIGSDPVLQLEDGSGRILDANNACTAVYGYTRDELLRMSVMDLSNEPEETRKGLESRARWVPLRYHRKKDGTLFPVEITANDLPWKGKQVRIAAYRDITDRKRAEEALRESEVKASRLAGINMALAEIGRIISSTLSIEEVYEQFAIVVKSIIPFDRLTVGIINAEQDIFFYQHTIGIELAQRKKGDRVPLPPIVADVVRKRSGVFLHADDEGFPKNYPTLSALFKVGIRSIISAPLFSKDEVIGTLLFGSLNSQSYTEGDLRLAEEVARQISGAIANAQLFAEHQRTEKALQESERKLEDLVKERTGELEKKSRTLEELNVTLRVLLRQVQEDRENLEHRLVSNVKRLVLPYVEKVKMGHLDERTRSHVRIVESNLNEIMSPFLHKVQHLSLTPRETQVAALIKDGKTTKEIGELMGIAPSAVNTLRNRMRSKLHLNKKKINLRTYLQSLE